MQLGKKLFFFSCSIGLFIYVLVRAWNLDVTIDEAATLMYLENMNINAMLTTANTHWLNSILVKLISLFTKQIFCLRLPNVFAFVLYAFFSFKYLRNFSWPIFVCGAFLLLLNPYVLDFFSLARGYGLCMGFAMASFYYLNESLLFGKDKKWLFAIGFGVLAMASNYSILFYFLILSLLYVIHAKWPTKREAYFNYFLLFLTNAICLINILLIKLIGNDLGGGGRDSFLQNTLGSLYINTRYWMAYKGSTILAGNLILFISILAIGSLGTYFFFVRKKYNYLASVLVLGIGVLINLFFYIAGIPFPAFRTAVFLAPFLALLFIDAMKFIELKRSQFTYVPTILLSGLLLFNFYNVANLDYTKEWWNNSSTEEILGKILETSSSNQGEIVFASWYTNLNATKHYYTKYFPEKYPITSTHWYASKSEEGLETANYLTIPIRLLDSMHGYKNFEMLQEYPKSGMALLKKRGN